MLCIQRYTVNRRTLIALLAAGSVAGCVGDDGTAAEDAAGASGTDTGTSAASAASTSRISARGLVTVERDGGVDAVADEIRAAIEDSPLTLVATIDHAENAASVDADLPPTRLFVFGNPEMGTPLMQERRTVGIDLPQKLLVWDDDGQTRVAYNDPSYLAERHGLEGQDDRLEKMASALHGLATGGS